MSLPAVSVDFVSRPRVGGVGGLVLLAVGIGSMSWVSITSRQLYLQAAGLELRLEDLQSRASPPAADPRVMAEEGKILAETRRAAAALRTPWPALLTELEQASEASKGLVAVISIEPDRAQNKVRLVVEARSFPAVFTYVHQLQSSEALQDPLLDSHEILTRVAERPVRVQITADWRQSM